MRIPISLVLSVTETSIIFITPTPPTKSDMDAIPARSMARAFDISFAVLSFSSLVAAFIRL